MTTLRMLSLYALIGFVCGCGSPQAEPETSAGNDSRKGPVASQKQESNGKPESVQEITFYLAGMNKGLKIL